MRAAANDAALQRHQERLSLLDNSNTDMGKLSLLRWHLFLLHFCLQAASKVAEP